jgi:predicted  nucleic acid-binding Zn ribbon protein
MLTAQVKFQRVDTRRSIHHAADVAGFLVSTWRRNGQVVGEWQISATKEAITAYVSVLERSSLSKKLANEYVKREW